MRIDINTSVALSPFFLPVDITDVLYLSNAYELMDQKGKWFFDKNNQQIYYIPLDGEDMTTAEVYIPVVEKLITVYGDSTSAKVLPTTGINGSTISWASDKEYIITTSGTVVRTPEIGADAKATLTATLTATIINGTTNLVKTYFVTVIKTPYGINTNFDDNAITGWEKSNSTASGVTMELYDEGGGNKSYKIAKNVLASWPKLYKSIASPISGVSVVEAKIKCAQTSFSFRLYGLDAGGAEKEINWLIFGATNFTSYTNGKDVNNLTTKNIITNYSTSTWYDIKVILYPSTGLHDIYVNGVKILHDVTARNSGVVNLSRISFEIPNNVSQGEAYFDNVKVYRLATDQEMVINDVAQLSFSQLSSEAVNAITQNLTLPTIGYTGLTTISWSSSNTTVISNAGVVTRPLATESDASVALTATVTTNGVNQAVIFNVTVPKKPYSIYTILMIVQ